MRGPVAVLVVVALLAGCEAVPESPTVSHPTPWRAASCTVPARLAGQDVDRLPGDKPRVALTFDGGSNADGVPSILRTLKGKEARATFFLTGDFVRSFPRKARRIARLHLVGNHTNTHANAVEASDTALRAEITAAERAIVRVTGQDPRRFFRFPFGARTDHDIDVVNGLCYVPFRWTVDTLGWKGTRVGVTVKSIVNRVRDASSPGSIVLMHVGANPDDGSTLDADALARVIDLLRGAGYRLVRLSSVMRAAP